MRRTQDRPELHEALTRGEVSFDRVEALSKIQEDVGLLQHLDVGGVHREAAKRVRLSTEDESRSAAENFMVMQPTLDETWVKFWGGLDGYSGALVDKVLSELPTCYPRCPTVPKMTVPGGAVRRANCIRTRIASPQPPL